MSDKIVIVGYMNTLTKLDGFEIPSTQSNADSSYDTLPHYYMITQTNGMIACLSDGLNIECGLNSKYFMRREEGFHAIHFETIMGTNVCDLENQEALSTTGINSTIDTRNILNHVNLEQMTSEEVLETKIKSGVYPCQVIKKRLDFGLCAFDFWRIVLTQK